MDLAELFQRVIEEHRARINAAAEKYPGEPIQIQLDYHPQMKKVETVIRPSDRPKPFRIDSPL